MKTRLEGLTLLALCALVLHRIYLLVHALPRHDASPLELGLGLLAVLLGIGGAGMILVGPDLFRAYLWPPPDSD